MKKLALWLMLALMGVLSVSAVSALDLSAGPQSMAKHFPATTDFFVAVRTDDGFVETLDGVLSNVVNKINAANIPDVSVPPISLRQALEFAIPGVPYSEMRTWLGDYAAIGISDFGALIADRGMGEPNMPKFSVVLSITDKASVISLLESLMTNQASVLESKAEAGDYTTYTSTDSNGVTATLGISNELFVLTTERLPGISREATLDSNSDLQTAINQLPAPAYNIVSYVNASAVMSAIYSNMSEAELAILQAQGISLENFGPVVVGFTLLDGRSFTIDVVQKGTEMAMQMAVDSVNTDFMRHIPASSDAIIIGQNLTQIFNISLDSINAALSQMGESTDLREQILSGTKIFGIDLEQDLLSWSTGTYGLVLGVDLQSVVPLLGPSATDPAAIQNLSTNFPLDAALVLDSSANPEAARGLVSKLTTFLQGVVGSSPQAQQAVTIGSANIAGTDVTSIRLELPLGLDGTFPITFVLGASDEVFVFGLEGTAQDILTQSNSLAEDATYQDAAQFFIPNTYLIAYTNDEGLIETFAIPALTLVGPAVGRVFDNIQDGLQGSAPATRQTVQMNNPMAQVLQVLQLFNDIVASSSATAAYLNEEWVVSRLVLTLER